jgi:ribosomal protein L21E
MAPTDEQTEQLDSELTLLQAMYPESVIFDPRSRELKYTSPSSSKAQLVLRIPYDYPSGDGMALVISATDKAKNDIRDKVTRDIDVIADNEPDGPVLDLWIARYEELLADVPNHLLLAAMDSVDKYQTQHQLQKISISDEPKYKTVIIWLHHLLNTNKRKLATSPSLYPDEISGITKPGYPGVLLYTGCSHAVDAHVQELKDQRWQAFQIRHDSSLENAGTSSIELNWRFAGVQGKIIEVETMAEVVQAIVDEDKKQMFLKAIGVK